MKNILLFIALIPFIGFSQPFDFSAKSFDFQSVYYPNADSMKLTLTNSTGFDIGVEGISVFSVYGKKPFTVKDSVFTMTVGNSHDVWIHFEPEQNILHQMYAVIETDFRGDYLVSLTGKGKFSNSYYSTTYNKSEQDLKAALKSRLAQGYQQQSYNVARDNMYGNIDNVNGDVTCVYTGRIATFNTRPGATANNFNCEHTFPQGFFNKNLPMRSDVHHLYATDITSNSQRGNLQFGVVSNPTWSNGGSKKGNGKFEPRNAQKGQVARSLFYFVVRYQDYSNHVLGQESILRTWYAQYPVTSADSMRNEDIYSLQKNRNPFVDYPQFLKRISKISGNSVPANHPGLYVSRDTVDMRFQKDSLIYTISIVNYGNTGVQLTDFAISNTTHFHFDYAVSDKFLLPGDAVEIYVAVNPQSNITVTEELTFTTDIVGMENQKITLLGEWGTVSVQEKKLVAEPKLYPNPAQNNVIVSWENQSRYEVKIYSTVGALMYFEEVTTTTKNIDVSNLPVGVYMVQTSNGMVVKQVSLVIQ